MIRSHIRGWWSVVQARPLTSWTALVLLIGWVLIASGTTVSSVGVPALRDDPAVAPKGLIAGSPRTIRSDDFLRSTPWSIGMLTSRNDRFYSPLVYPDTALVAPGTGGFFGRFLHPEAALIALIGPVIPEQAFAFGWWFAPLLTALLGPVWLRQLGVAPRIGIPITLLILLAPTTAWWSWAPLTVLAWALLAATATLGAVTKLDAGRKIVGILLAAVGAIAFARLALTYQPWSIPSAIAILAPTLAAILQQTPRRIRASLVVGSVVVVGMCLVLAFYREHASALEVLTNTVYPGSRRSTGAMSSLAALFGAPHDWVLQQAAPPLIGTNQSELSSGYLILGLIAFLLVPVIDWTRAGLLRPVTITSLAALALLAAWCSIEWPSAGTHLFPMSLVSPKRLVQVLGYVGTFTFAFAYAAYAQGATGSRRAVVLTTSSAAFFVTAMAGSALRQTHLSEYRTPWIALVAIATAVVIAVAVRFTSSRFALIPTVVLAIPVVAVVNPIQQGFADLHSGSTAQAVRRLGQELHKGERWAADDIYFDALLMANAQPAVSGQQWLGPRVAAWRILDPHEKERTAWNRGASFIALSWSADGSKPRVWSQQADIVNVALDPCGSEAAKLGVRLVSSGRALDNTCLRERGTTTFGGIPRWWYEVGPPPIGEGSGDHPTGSK